MTMHGMVPPLPPSDPDGKGTGRLGQGQEQALSHMTSSRRGSALGVVVTLRTTPHALYLHNMGVFQATVKPRDGTSPEELDVSSFFSSSSLSLFSPPVSVPASRSLSVSLDSSTLMVGVLGRLLLLGSLPLLRPPGRLGGVFIRSAVRAAANSLAPSYEVKHRHQVKFYTSFRWRRKGLHKASSSRNGSQHPFLFHK